MNSASDSLSGLIERLHAAELIPPIKSVETISGGTVRAIVVGTLAPEARARLTAVMGSTPWKVIETGDPHVARVDFRPSPEQDPS